MLSGTSEHTLKRTNFLRSNNAKHALWLIKSEQKFADFVAIQLFPAVTKQNILDNIEVFEIDRQVSNSVGRRKQDFVACKKLRSPGIY